MALFLTLFLGHLLGDFVFQPGRLVVAKRHGIRGMLLHTGIVVACSAVVSAARLSMLWPAVVLAGVAHLGIEYLTVRARRLMEANGLALFLLDQALHVVSLAIIAAMIDYHGTPVIGPWSATMTTLAIVCGIVTAMFFGSILAFEVRVLSLGARNAGPAGPILRMDASRLYGFVERGAAVGIALVSPVPLLGVVAFVPRIGYAVARSGPDRARHMSDAAVGVATAAAVYVLIIAAASNRF